MGNHLAGITEYLWRQSWQLAVLIVAVAVVSWMLRNRSAHVRYLLWLIVLAKCLVPPFLTVPLAILPAEQSAEPLARLPVAPPLVIPEVPEQVGNRSMAKPSESVEKDTSQPRTSRLSMPSGQQVLGAVWIAGMAAFGCVAIVKVVRSNLRLRRQRRTLPDDLQANVGELLRGFGMKSHPRVWLLDGVGQPFVWGLLRGDIYLPADYLRIDNGAHRRNILGHEVCHILRWDAAVNSLQVLAQALFWFHPLVWWANQRIRMEREKCCDEMAVAHLGTRAKEYSAAIVKALISEHESTRPVPSLAVAGPVKDVEERIKTMLRPGKKFYRRPSLVTMTLVLLLASLTVPTGLVLTAKAQEKSAAGQSPGPTSKDKAAATTALFRAIKAGNVDRMKLAISQGADLDAKNNIGRTPLHIAVPHAVSPKYEMVKLLLEAGANPNTQDMEGQTPLHTASRGWHLLPVRLLVSAGSNINARDNKGMRPVMIAFELGQTDMFDLMVANGATVPSDLMVAYKGDRTRVQSLIENGKVQETFEQDLTLLHAAALGGHTTIVELLLTNGLDVHSQTQAGCTPLHYAAAGDHRKVAEILLAKGADVKAEAAIPSDFWHPTPLHLAIREKNKDMIKWLLEKGANPNGHKNSGATPLHWAVWKWDTDIAELLMSYGGDIHVTTKYKWSPLYDAVWAGDGPMVETLINKAKDAMAAKWAPLHVALASGDRQEIEALLAKGVDVNAKGERGWSPLHMAARTGDKDIVERLIEKGADVNAEAEKDIYMGVSDEGMTPLHMSCRCGHIGVVELLIDKGAEVNVETNNGKTPQDVAREYGYPEIVELLKKHGAKQ